MADFGLYADDDEEDVLAPKEPQVTSDKPEERKAARALRIKRRQEALKRQEQAAEEVAAEEAPGLIEQATASAAEELQRLALEGNEKVTNVKVTTDAREVDRRYNNLDKNNEFTVKIEEEAKVAQLKYEAISGRWEYVLQLAEPLDIDAEVGGQRAACDALVRQKDDLIQQLKDELKRMDLAYCEDLEKQDQDIKELSERVERQVTMMQRAYAKQLFLIETAVAAERNASVEHNQRRWEALYKQRDREELAHMEHKFKQCSEFSEGIEEIGWQHHENYRAVKMELETLVQELQKELEKLKAVCLINGEKIGYNYQVLKKREEENVFVRSQQKRKLNKMADVMNALRNKIRKAAEDGALEESKGDVEIAKLKQAMSDLENKCAHFSHVNDYKLQQVWRMNVARCAELARCVRRCEVALHSHVLAEPPPPPPSFPPTLQVSEAGDKETSNNMSSPEVIDENNTAAIEAKRNLVQHILSLVADNTGFLVENRLHELLEKRSKCSKTICSLDAIFNALEVHREQDVEMLCKTFLTYAFCPICFDMDDISGVTEQLLFTTSQEDTQGGRSIDRVRNSHGMDRSSMRAKNSLRSVSPTASRSTHTHITFRSGYDPKLSDADQALMIEAGEVLQQYMGPITSDTTGAHEAAPAAAAAAGAAGDVGSGGGGGGGGGGGSGVRRARGVTVTDDAAALGSNLQSHNPFLCPVGHTLEIEPMQVLAALGDFVGSFVSPEKEELNEILESVKPRDFSTPSRRLRREAVDEYWGKFRAMFPETKDKLWSGVLAGLASYLPVLQEREKLHEQVKALRERNQSLRRLVREGLPPLPRDSAARAPAAPSYLRAQPAAFTATAAHTTLPHI